MNKVLALLIAFTLASSVHAGNCHAPQVVRRVQNVQVVRSFGRHNYVALDHVLVAHDPYFQVGSGLREDAIAERAAEKAVEKTAAKLQSKIDEMEKRLANYNKLSGKGTFTFSANGEEGDSGPVVDPPADDSGDPVDGPKAAPFSVPALKNLCAKCHAGSSAKAGFDMSKPMSWAQVNDIQRRTHTDDAAIRMPPDGRITSSERQQIFEWSVSR